MLVDEHLLVSGMMSMVVPIGSLVKHTLKLVLILDPLVHHAEVLLVRC